MVALSFSALLSIGSRPLVAGVGFNHCHQIRSTRSMKTSTKLTALFLAAVSPAAFAQHELKSPLLAGARASAQNFVYVSSLGSESQTQIDAYAVGPDGDLRPVPGSPFAENGTTLAARGNWLFSSDTVSIYSFSVAANGALTLASSINAQAYNGYADGGPINLFFDRTGTTLYDLDIYGNLSANNTYQFFHVARSGGALSYLGATSVATPNFDSPLSFVRSNQYAYGAGCYHGDQALYGFSRTDGGDLSDLNLTPPFPAAQNGAYCPYLAVDDGQNHLAVSLSPNNDLTPTGPTQLAVYMADSSGNLTTTSTSQNMPAVSIGNLNAMAMSPSGKMLAVGGSGGLQVFHFNGADPITVYTGLLTADQISQVAWDNDNHLYAIGSSSGKLYVFTFTPRNYSQAPGSPHMISSPLYLAVLPRPHKAIRPLR